MLHLSVCLSVPFSDAVPFARWQYARVDASNAFDKGQLDWLCPRSNAVSKGVHIASPCDTFWGDIVYLMILPLPFACLINFTT